MLKNSIINYLKLNIDTSFKYDKDNEVGEVLSRDFLDNVLNPIKLQFEDSNIEFSMPNKIPNTLINIDVIRIEQVLGFLYVNTL